MIVDNNLLTICIVTLNHFISFRNVQLSASEKEKKNIYFSETNGGESKIQQ